MTTESKMTLLFFHGAVRPQKQYGLLGTREEWNKACEPVWPSGKALGW